MTRGDGNRDTTSPPSTKEKKTSGRSHPMRVVYISAALALVLPNRLPFESFNAIFGDRLNYLSALT